MNAAVNAGTSAGTPAFSKVRRGGGLLFVSGEVAHRPEGTAPAGVFRQTELILEHLAATLAAEHHELSDIVQVTAYLSRSEDFAEFNRAYRQHFKPPYPARTTVVAQALYPDACVEVAVIAASPTACRAGSEASA